MGASKSFVTERPVLLPGMMAMISLATVVALRWLAKAATRLYAAATCPAKQGPVNRAHSAHSPTLKGRLGPKSTVFSAFRLDSARCKLALTGRGSKRTDESAREHVCFGDRALALLRFRAYSYVIFKDHALTDELGICPTRVIHALAGGARGREQNFTARTSSACSQYVCFLFCK